MSEETLTENFGFQTEAKQLLRLMIHSLYSNKEIFLRELISNASDAIDKHRFAVLKDPSIAGKDGYRIRVSFNPSEGTLAISDNGIGMSRDEVIDHLGTIARSGTAEFLEQLSGDQQKDASLIGQFGVGFYSAFMVAKKVEVLTRRADKQHGTCWVSEGEDEFVVSELSDCEAGTTIVLHLTEDSMEFADGFRLRSVVKRYSDHIGVPVEMPKQNDLTEESEVKESVDLEEEWEVINSAKALWTRTRTEIADDEYNEFYKYLTHDFSDPLTWSHNKVEGKLEYTSLLYIPEKAPFDLWNRESPRGLKLYVERVFIMDEAEQFLPLYLRFVKGIIDCNDLPLNVSREILQQDERVVSIRGALTKRVLNTLNKMATKEPSQYEKFWEEFGEVLKEGAGEDFSNRESLAKLLRFNSTNQSDKPTKNVALDDYLDRSSGSQEKIYYLVADSYENARNSPHLEVYKVNNVEVLLLFDRIDEWVMSMLTEYQGKKFHDVARGEVEVGEEKQDEAESAEEASDHTELNERIKKILSDKVENVRASKRLTESAACLVLGEFGVSSQMRRMMEASGQPVPESKPDFEYNAKHPLIKRLDLEQQEEGFARLLNIIFDQAALAEGRPLEDPSGYVNRLNDLLVDLLN